MWYQSEFTNTSTDWLTRIQKRNQYIDYDLNLFMYRNIKNCFARKMEGVEASAENGSRHNNLDNIYVELNSTPSELLQTVKELIYELQL